MPEKKYYWLKLHKDFFKQKEIKRLRKIAGGDVYTIIYLKMLLQSLETDGYLYYDGYYDSFEAELADDIDEDEENVKVVIQYLLSKGLMEEHDDDAYLLTKCKEMTGSEVGSAARVRRHRERLALQSNGVALQCNNAVTNCNTEIEKEKELELEKKKNISMSDTCLTNDRQMTAQDSIGKVSKGKKNNMSIFDDDFEDLWKLYPKKDGKVNAKKAFIKAMKAGVTKETIADGIRRYIAYINATGQYVKNGSTWFNQECWNDEYKLEGRIKDEHGSTDPRKQYWNADDPTVF